MRLSHRCEAEGLVLLGVRLAPDPKESEIEQSHRPRQDALAGQVVAVEQGDRRPAESGQAASEREHAVELLAVAPPRHCSWYRYCLRPAESIPVAWRWPRGSGQIHTSAHAGGIASARIRSIARESAQRRARRVAVFEPAPSAASRDSRLGAVGSPESRPRDASLPPRPPARKNASVERCDGCFAYPCPGVDDDRPLLLPGRLAGPRRPGPRPGGAAWGPTRRRLDPPRLRPSPAGYRQRQ